jgi:FAD:protein FMN transferase
VSSDAPTRPRPAGRSAGAVLDRAAAPAIRSVEPLSLATPSMGGRLVIHLDPGGRSFGPGRSGSVSDVSLAARRGSRQVVARVERWAARLTRHAADSELIRLNGDPRHSVPVGPTLAAALAAGQGAARRTGGLVDIALLDARLAAEAGLEPSLPSERDWTITQHDRGGIVRRPHGIRFDLGGVGKGWIADRALALLDEWPGAAVDADGDLAVRVAPGSRWSVEIDDPRDEAVPLARLSLAVRGDGPPRTWGVATSGTSVHRWDRGGVVRHHLIDPRTGRSAETDVVQATVVAGSALAAESLAKAAVIAGVAAGFGLLERARVAGAVLLTASGQVLALPQTLLLVE